jgi:hypothetical protein
VLGVENSVRVSTVPEEADLHSGIQGADGSVEQVQGRAQDLACFQARDRALRTSREPGQVVLAEAPHLSKGSDEAADPWRIHG